MLMSMATDKRKHPIVSFTSWGLGLGVVSVGLLVFLVGCGDVNARKGGSTGMDTCQDIHEQYHFRVFIPPWKYVREYRCDDGDFRNCNLWTPTGRYVFVVSDAPFVSFDSEIITSLTVEEVSASGVAAVGELMSEIDADAESTLVPPSADEDYRVYETEAGDTVYDVFWRQMRNFEGKDYKWHRRDAFVEVGTNRLFHLEFFSLHTLQQPEFDVLVKSFTEGPAPGGAPRCVCVDERVTPAEPCF